MIIGTIMIYLHFCKNNIILSVKEQEEKEEEKEGS